MNKTLKAYIISGIISFISGFALIVLADIDSLSLGSLKDGGLAGLFFVAVRTGIKYLLQDFLVSVGNKIGK